MLPIFTARDTMMDVPKPTTRAECQRGEEARPCPWASCRHHLLLEVALSGDKRRRPTSLRLNKANSQGGRRPGLRSSVAARDLVREWIDDALQLMVEMPYTCTLDVVRDYPDGLPASAVGELLGVTRQAIEREEKHDGVVRALEELREYANEE